MKKIFLVLFLFSMSVMATAQTSEIKWVSLEQALAMQKKAGKAAKPIFLDVYTVWCGPCKLLDKTTFVDPQVVKTISEKYIAVKFNGEGAEVVNYLGKKYSNPNYNPSRKGRNATHQLTDLLELEGYPSLFILGPDGVKQKTIIGYRTAPELLDEI